MEDDMTDDTALLLLKRHCPAPPVRVPPSGKLVATNNSVVPCTGQQSTAASGVGGR